MLGSERRQRGCGSLCTAPAQHELLWRNADYSGHGDAHRVTPCIDDGVALQRDGRLPSRQGLVVLHNRLGKQGDEVACAATRAWLGG